MNNSKSQAVKDWRNNTKKRIVQAMGGCCQICSYNKCNNALELHHIDPSQKELSFSQIRANPKSWEKIVLELKKSILLCSNCHKEVHAGITQLPETFAVFDESFSDYKNNNLSNKICQAENCETNIMENSKYCSLECTQKSLKGKGVVYDWSDLYQLKYEMKLTAREISNIKKCSLSAVKKQLKNLHAAIAGFEPALLAEPSD